MKILLYTPVYYTSPGTQMRVNLLRKSLNYFGISSIVVCDDFESVLKKMYHMNMNKKWLANKTFWYMIGLVLAKKICKWTKHVDVVVLFTDITAASLPFIRKCFDKIILSIEDLTSVYRGFSPDLKNRFNHILMEFARYADYIITPSHTLSMELKELGLTSYVVPIGSESYVSFSEAINRSAPIKIVHTGRLNELEQIRELQRLSKKYKLIVHKYGEYSNLKEIQLNKNIILYKTQSPEDAVKLLKNGHIGLIINHRYAFTLSRIYYHIGLLQPLIVSGSGPWIREMKILGIKTFPVDEDYITNIIENYSKYINDLYKIRSRLLIPHVHRYIKKLILGY